MVLHAENIVLVLDEEDCVCDWILFVFDGGTTSGFFSWGVARPVSIHFKLDGFIINYYISPND